MNENLAIASKTVIEKKALGDSSTEVPITTTATSISDVQLAPESDLLKTASGPQIGAPCNNIEASSFKTAVHAIDCESMFARLDAFKEAMSTADSLEARTEIKAQYEKESNSEIQGGAYSELPSIEGKERHHMPCDYANEGFVNRENGPALVMDKEDHRETASCGRSREACEYRDDQRELLKNGQWEKAIQMDIDDIHDKFGSKYDEGISKLSEYAKTIYSHTISETK